MHDIAATGLERIIRLFKFFFFFCEIQGHCARSSASGTTARVPTEIAAGTQSFWRRSDFRLSGITSGEE